MDLREELLLQESLLNIDEGISPRETYTIPFDQVRHVLRTLPYASSLRVMFFMLAMTGSRIQELDNMHKDSKNFIGRRFYWSLGKNQEGERRHVDLPDYFINELRDYWEQQKTKRSAFFSMTADSFVNKFNKKRHLLGQPWTHKVVESTNFGHKDTYNYQMKFLRKNFLTFTFHYYLQKVKDPYLAMEYTAAEAKHSTKGITPRHYVKLEFLESLEKYKHLEMAEILRTDRQQTL